MLPRKTSGFGLVEIMIVIAIIAIIAAVAIPTLYAARTSAQGKATFAVLRTITSAEQTYYSASEAYGDFVALNALGILDNRFTQNTVIMNAYSITIVVTDEGRGFLVTATPQMTGAPVLSVDESFRIMES